MSFLTWPLCLSILIFLLAESVDFHKATVCRQDAWLMSTVLLTRGLLKPQDQDQDWHHRCKILVHRNQEKISWRKIPQLRSHPFTVELDGRL